MHECRGDRGRLDVASVGPLDEKERAQWAFGGRSVLGFLVVPMRTKGAEPNSCGSLESSWRCDYGDVR